MEKLKRSEYDITKEILTLCFRNKRNTEIVYKANLNFQLLQRYLAMLESRGLIIHTKLRGKSGLTITTEKGKEWLEKFGKVNLNSPILIFCEA